MVNSLQREAETLVECLGVRIVHAYCELDARVTLFPCFLQSGPDEFCTDAHVTGSSNNSNAQGSDVSAGLAMRRQNVTSADHDFV